MFFATRIIIERLGLGLACRAARKLVPVVLTLKSGPSGFSKKLSGATALEGHVACARFRYFRAGGWPVGLPETIFRATAAAMAVLSTRSEQMTRFVDLGCGFHIVPHKQVINGQVEPFLEVCPKARSRRFDAGVGPVSGFPRELSGRRFCDSLGGARRSRSALGAGPLGFPKQLSGRRPKLPQQPWQPCAVARARSVILALKSGPSGFPKHFGAGEWPDGLPETSFQRRKAGNLGRRRGRRGFKSRLGNRARPAYGRFYQQWLRTRSVAAMDVLSLRSGYMARSVDFGCGWPISHCPAQAVYQRPGRGRNPARARRVPCFATRRIIEGLGLGLARRAARKLVPVVLTLGFGPVGLPEKTFCATAEASATAMANPRRRSRALRYCGAGGWPVGLPATTSGRRPKLPRQPWQTRAVVRARSVILALGAGPSGFPKQFSGRRPKHLRQRPSRSLPSF